MGFRDYKKTFALILLLIIIVGVFLWQGWEKTIFSKLKAVIAPELKFSEDSGLDVSDVDLEGLLPEGEEPAFAPDGASAGKEEDVGADLGEPEIIIISEQKMTLEKIEQEVNRIAKEVERIDGEVKKLKALAEIQERIDEIAEKVAEIRTSPSARTLIR